ncbi:MFS transporter [Aquisalimonas asiatica]|uniref:Predicted arabinose efflux permease, MFS family n=1 Tax=Aquisalimonas asiatica TaxID=406100 RepID=A0A1H8QHN6_9GAMM|nr:MFS transporter [Aquisalimonas asiatica]SEO53558.1 Predicted arabinose efflux permease, MFS family [Aquisalimonas asiatica]
MSQPAHDDGVTAHGGRREFSLWQLFVMVFLPFAAGYFLSYLFRTVNAVIATDLERDVGLSASDLGLLTAAYFLSFALFQLPLGVLLDRYGPRRVEAVLLVIAAAGAVLFAVGEGMAELSIGRALIGLGVSACLMASFKAFSAWFPAERLPLVNGCLLAFGGFGAMAATSPVEMALGWVDWRTIFLGLAVACVVTALAVWFVVPDESREARGGRLRDQLAGLRHVLTSQYFWRIAPLAMLTQGGSLAIQGLWAGPWMRDVAEMSRQAVADTLLLIALAMAVGFAAWGVISDRLVRRGVQPVHVLTLGVVLFLACKAVLVVQPQAGVVPLWMAFAFFGTSGTLVYAMISQQFPAALSGRANTAVNLAVFVGAFVLQWGIGFVIEVREFPDGGGYAPSGYALAFGGVLALQIAAFAWFLLPRRHKGVT